MVFFVGFDFVAVALAGADLVFVVFAGFAMGSLEVDEAATFAFFAGGSADAAAASFFPFVGFPAVALAIL